MSVTALFVTCVAEDVGVLHRFHAVIRRHVQQDVARSRHIHQHSTQ